MVTHVMRLLIGILLPLLMIQPALGAKLVVNQTVPLCETGNAYFNSIQDAINNANPGDEIVVCPGTYYEVLNIDKSLTIRGVSKPVVSALYNPKSHVITVKSDNVTIQGLVVRDAYGYYKDSYTYTNVSGIYIYKKNCNIRDVEITNIETIGSYYAVGIVAKGDNITIENIKISNIRTKEFYTYIGFSGGIWIYGRNVTVRNYEIRNLTGWPKAIELGYCSDVIVDEGIIENLESSYEKIDGILIRNCNDVIVRNFKIHSLKAPVSYGINGGVNISNVEIRDGKIWNLYGDSGSYGIYDRGNNDLIDNVEIFNCSYGIYLEESDDSEIRNCHIHDNGHGIYLYYSSYNTIERNIIENNTLVDTGIHIESGSHNEIHKNCFINNEPQAYDDGSNNNWDSNYWDPPPSADYTIQGLANSKDNDPLPHCPCFPTPTAKVPMLNIFGLTVLTISLITVTLLKLRKF